MNKFKKIIMGVLVMSMTAAELTACAPDPKKYEEQAVGMSVDSQKADMCVQEFMELKTKNRFAVYLIYSPAGLELKKMYQSLGNTFTGLECKKRPGICTG